MPLTASNIAAWTMAATRDICRGVVCATVPACNIAWFQSVTSSARTVAVKMLAKTAITSQALVILSMLPPCSEVNAHLQFGSPRLFLRFLDGVAYQRGPKMRCTEISDLGRFCAHRTLLLRSTQRICHQCRCKVRMSGLCKV